MHVDQVQLSAIDSERFGVQVARAAGVTSANLAEIIDFCHAQRVTMLVARSSTDHLTAAHAMESAGFRLMDTLVYYVFQYDRSSIPQDQGNVAIRSVQPGDATDVEQIAREAFRGYQGHYHVDPRLDSGKADEAYISWAGRSCVSRDVADEVLIAHEGATLLGFATLRMNNPEEGEGVLFGVAPAAQGQGIYRSFMIRAMHWAKEQHARRIVVSTQVNNIAVQKVWARLGFVMSHSFYTFHKWFDE